MTCDQKNFFYSSPLGYLYVFVMALNGKRTGVEIEK